MKAIKTLKGRKGMKKLKMIFLKKENVQKEHFKPQFIQPGNDLQKVIPNCAAVLVYKDMRNKKKNN